MTKHPAIIVDDEPHGISVLSKLLEKSCPDIDLIATCANVDEAIITIETLRPSLVFLDISMPEKSGFDLLAHF